MSLVNQLIAAIFAILIGLVSGTLYIMSESSRSILQDQLESHAQDSATHLGLYLGPYMAENDSATVETAVNAIFDSGFYQQIIVTNAEQGILFEKSVPSTISDDIPQWFQNLVVITPPSMYREVTYQWQQVGKIYVRSSADYAYDKLWKGAQDSIILFVSLSIICLLAISSLIRYLLRPLNSVEQQAIALSEKRYIEQEKLPSTRELRQVVEAMNRMIRRVKSMFEEQARNIEELRRNAYQDNLTGLSNQRATITQLAERIDYRKDFGKGTLFNIHLINLQKINQQIGMDKTNNLLKHLATLLEEVSRQADQSILGRITGADFVLLTSHTNFDQLKLKLDKVDLESRKLLSQLMNTEISHPIISVGSCECSDISHSSQLLSDAKIASEEATKESVLWKQYNSEANATNTQPSDWKQHVANAINQRKIFLQAQSVYSKSPNSMPIQDEIFTRILDRDNKATSAGEFINLVKELGLMTEMDRAVIELALQKIESAACPLTINLSHEAIQSDSLIDWLSKQLKGKSLAGKLLFEVDETAVLNNTDAITAFRKALKELDIGFGVDHFGVHPNGFSYLYSVQPDYVKIDGSLIREIDKNAEDRFFVSSLISVAHSLDIQAYAEHVERESQLQLLTQLEIDGSQGYLHGSPKELS
ncbi:EAL domain-containing protein [Neptuniibacter sp. 1_MG-2023]|uniref:bifunctional diguanylate cyclase/phosphodiesterase n=1 Tax=Neptuniibacter sp. 1_MG-2023 TaxID=3062662 RepID=UPI0026E3D3BC|nr:EAL domain-containing protein [Neptuniibacter sp. 1_MG-2023]MDO6592428.1 EAL domain-containing protein [Neptuniibacter sp. 1_MG-2023]